MRARARMVALGVVAMLPACGARGAPDGQADAPDAPGTICTLEARASFVVSVVDSVSGHSLAPDAAVRVTSGTFSETLAAAPEGGTYSGVYERPGEYVVEVTHPGYETWRRAGVRVERDECHVIAQRLTARLVPR